MTQIPVLLFERVPEQRLRQIFKLYNVSSTRLNAAEIRNAVYQNNRIHRALFILSGESAEGVSLPYLASHEQERFVSTLRQALPSTKRFAALDFLCRYLAYSRAPTNQPIFRAASTSTAVNRYFDLCAPDDKPEIIVKEIMHVFDRAQEYFDIEEDGEETHSAFFRRNLRGERKFEALQAITSMVCARLLDRVEALEIADRNQIARSVRKMIAQIEYPTKQQYTTIWDHQSQRFLGLAEDMGVNLSTFDGGAFKVFADRMNQARLEAPYHNGTPASE